MRRALIWAVALASTIGFGYLAIRDAHPDEVWDALQEANIWWVVPSFAVLVAAVAVRALRWQLLFQRETRPPYGATAASTIVGLAVNSLLPLRAGEAARVIALNRAAGTSPVESAATVALERILDVFCLLLLLLAALPWLPDVDWVGAAAAIALALALMLGGAALLFAVYGDRPFHALDRLLRRLPFGHHEWVEHVGASLRRGLVALRDPKLALTAFVLTTVGWLLTSVSFWLLTLAFDLELPLVVGRADPRGRRLLGDPAGCSRRPRRLRGRNGRRARRVRHLGLRGAFLRLHPPRREPDPVHRRRRGRGPVHPTAQLASHACSSRSRSPS